MVGIKVKIRNTKNVRRSAKAIDWLAEHSGPKELRDSTIDKYLFVAAADLGMLYGAAEIIDRSDFSDPTNGMIMAAAGMGILALNSAASFSETARPVREYVGRLNQRINRSKILSRIKTSVLATGLTLTLYGINPYLEQMKQDFIPSTRDAPLATDTRPTISGATRERPRVYEAVGHTDGIKYDFTGTKLADENSTTGRIQRTLRWQQIYRAVEEAHGPPRDTLAGMIMQESYGDPVQPNARDDGGLGVVHIQGPRAKEFGLKIYGESNISSDKNHGKQIRAMLEGCNYDPACAEKKDDRAHVLKVLDAAARIVREGKEKYGTWDAGVEHYRAPGKVGKHLTWEYLHDVKNWKNKIQNQESLKKAAADFEKRNGYSFDTYIFKWHAMSDNWGLKEYVKATNLNR